MSSSVISVITKTPTLLKELQKKLPHINFHKVENADEQFKKSHIIVGDFDLIGPHLYELHNAKWIQGTWAGVELLLKYAKPDTPPNLLVTRFTGKHFGTEMSEYVVSHMINHERNMFEIRDNQKLQQWSREGKIWSYRTLPDLNVGILGLGTIGVQIAKTLKFLGAKVCGLGRRETLDSEKSVHIDKYYSKNSLPQFLENCDYLISILPKTTESNGFLNGNALESCKGRNTVFINIGRGSIISEECLVNALERKWISAAILDVFEKEPLSSESPLWKMSNLGIRCPEDWSLLISYTIGKVGSKIHQKTTTFLANATTNIELHLMKYPCRVPTRLSPQLLGCMGMFIETFGPPIYRFRSVAPHQYRVVITPHVSGVSRPQDVAELMSENLKCFEKNLPLPGLVNFSTGY